MQYHNADKTHLAVVTRLCTKFSCTHTASNQHVPNRTNAKVIATDRYISVNGQYDTIVLSLVLVLSHHGVGSGPYAFSIIRSVDLRLRGARNSICGLSLQDGAAIDIGY